MDSRLAALSDQARADALLGKRATPTVEQAQLIQQELGGSNLEPKEALPEPADRASGSLLQENSLIRLEDRIAAQKQSVYDRIDEKYRIASQQAIQRLRNNEPLQQTHDLRGEGHDARRVLGDQLLTHNNTSIFAQGEGPQTKANTLNVSSASSTLSKADNTFYTNKLSSLR